MCSCSVPLIVVTFIALWAVNVWLLDKLRMPYTFVLNVKQSKLPVTHFYTYG